ncbi:mitochondrial import receptor chain [Phakopsora pachyrhizi]|nr:mitochondrial import receptor chain [Phakopsora pachyrhizi]
MPNSTARQVLTIGGISLLTLGLSYCFYFDYKRRNDPVFRKKLIKEQRKAANQRKFDSNNSSKEAELVLAAAVAAVNAEPLPTTPTGKENYFMEQVGMGEMLAGRMPQGAVPAAIAFFKAYKVYPSPQELMMIYQRTMPPEVFAIVVEMIKLDVNQAIKSSKPSSSKLSVDSPDGPLIEEIISEEKPQAKASEASTPPQSSQSLSATNNTSSPQSTPTSSSIKPDKSAPGFSLNSGPETKTSSATPSESGSQGASQTGHSFVLVEEDAPPTIVPAKATSETEAAIEPVEVSSLPISTGAQTEILKAEIEEKKDAETIIVPV